MYQIAWHTEIFLNNESVYTASKLQNSLYHSFAQISIMFGNPILTTEVIVLKLALML